MPLIKLSDAMQTTFFWQHRNWEKLINNNKNDSLPQNPPLRWWQSMKRALLVQTRITKNKTLILMLLRVSFFFICQQSLLPSVPQQFSLHTDMRESVLVISTGLCYSNMWLSISCIIILRTDATIDAPRDKISMTFCHLHHNYLYGKSPGPF